MRSHVDFGFTMTLFHLYGRSERFQIDPLQRTSIHIMDAGVEPQERVIHSLQAPSSLSATPTFIAMDENAKENGPLPPPDR